MKGRAKDRASNVPDDQLAAGWLSGNVTVDAARIGTMTARLLVAEAETAGENNNKSVAVIAKVLQQNLEYVHAVAAELRDFGLSVDVESTPRYFGLVITGPGGLAKRVIVNRRPPLGENKKPGYIDWSSSLLFDAPPSSPADTSRRDRMGEDFNTKVKQAKAENLARGNARPVMLQMATYRAVLANVDLLNPDLPEAEKLTRARRLVRAYHRVKERRPKFRDRNKQLKAAFSIVNRHEYPQTVRRRTALKVAAAG